MPKPGLSSVGNQMAFDEKIQSVFHLKQPEPKKEAPAVATADRNGWIDVMRAMSAIAVVFFHFNRMPVLVPADKLSTAWHSVWLRGYWGVGVFFTLSRFCVYPGWNRATSCLNFLRRRAVRIFPPYWASLILVVGVALAVKMVTGVNDVAALPREPRAVIATGLLLTDPVSAIPTINWVYWTLSYVGAFYLLSSLVLCCPKPSRIPALAGAHILCCLIDVAWPQPATGPLFFIKHWPEFGLGLALALFYENRKIGCAMLLASALHVSWLIAHQSEQTQFVAVGCVTAACLVMCRDRRLPAALRALACTGEFSYSLYLVHVPIGIYVLMRFLPVTFAQPFSYIGSQLLLLAGTLIAAALFYFAAERPFLRRRPSAQ